MVAERGIWLRGANRRQPSRSKVVTASSRRQEVLVVLCRGYDYGLNHVPLSECVRPSARPSLCPCV